MKLFKKAVAVLTAATLTLSALSFSSSAENPNSIYTKTDKASVGETIISQVCMNSQGKDVGAIQFTVSYDSGALKFAPPLDENGEEDLSSIFPKELYDVGSFYASANPRDGYITVAMFYTEEVFKDGEVVLAALPFEVLDLKSNSVISLSDIVVVNVTIDDITNEFDYVKEEAIECAHKYVDIITEIEDCEKGGTKTTTCMDCGKLVSTENVAPAKHIVDTWEETKKATCVNKGEEEGICIVCGKTVARETEMTDHSFGEWTIVNEATCTAMGEKTRVCSVCGKTETQSIDALGHNFGEWSVAKEATCTENGSLERVCSRCGEKETQSIDALGHNFGDWAVTTKPTCTEKGEETRTCSVCGTTETRPVDALGHQWSEWKVVEEPTTKKEGKEEHQCSRCGEKETRAIEKLPIITLEDTDTGIKVEGGKLNGLTLDVVPGEATSTFVAYEITLKNGAGEIVQPEIEVTVMLPVPEGFDESKCVVYRKEVDGSYTDMKAEHKDGYLIFDTDHFSEYVISYAIKLGDLDNNGTVNIVDALTTLKAATGKLTLSELQKAAADVNNDKKVNVVDALTILKAATGKVEL